MSINRADPSRYGLAARGLGLCEVEVALRHWSAVVPIQGTFSWLLWAVSTAPAPAPGRYSPTWAAGLLRNSEPSRM